MTFEEFVFFFCYLKDEFLKQLYMLLLKKKKSLNFRIINIKKNNIELSYSI